MALLEVKSSMFPCELSIITCFSSVNHPPVTSIARLDISRAVVSAIINETKISLCFSIPVKVTQSGVFLEFLHFAYTVCISTDVFEITATRRHLKDKNYRA